ncbi:hypothetical protein [Marinomonas balearica]|uniref:Uncharacterized protein n=1 Tax=Marinomonas balearica TaxID=491947 RepID=A0A4R6MCL0_9GAMM|nr:hypothetical protein [Marinomonas balearica]TDO99387.1 hypothetical protein DFP79_0368 [Marinomonas balearica]
MNGKKGQSREKLLTTDISISLLIFMAYVHVKSHISIKKQVIEPDVILKSTPYQ